MSRRRFLQETSALGIALTLGMRTAHAELPPPEIKGIRLVLAKTMCMAPQYIAEDLLHAEGFDKVEYVEHGPASGKYSRVWIPDMIADGAADLSMSAIPGLLSAMDRGGPITLIAGIHAGCYELFGHDGVGSIRDLQGRRVAAVDAGDEKLFISSMMAYVGKDPRSDIRWVGSPTMEEAMQLFIDRKVDAFLGFPPQPQELRARKIGRMFLSTAADRPWSQYYCCFVSGNSEFVRKHPVATKRALRALLKAADICARTPDVAARFMVDKGYVQDYRYALGLVTDLPYDRWRVSDPEDTVRFYALRLQEVGMLKNNPQKLIERGTDWRFLNELKRELKA